MEEIFTIKAVYGPFKIEFNYFDRNIPVNIRHIWFYSPKPICLKMYKDVMSSSWMMKQVVRYWNEEGPSRTTAMIISFGIWFGYLYMFLNLIDS